MIEVSLLGQFAVKRDGVPVTIASRPAQLLLAYLLLHPGAPQPREKLAGLLWPEAPETNARNNLNQAVWRLRQALGQDALQSDEAGLAFNYANTFTLDVSLLDRKATGRATADDLLAAVSAYVGELLPGVDDEWVALERERLQGAYERQLEALLERLFDQQRWAEVLEWAERWIALGTTPEPAYRALMRAHAGRGDASAMAAVYERCVAALRDGLAVEPSGETRALKEQLARSQSLTVTLSPPTRHNLPAQLASFIGREQEMAELCGWLAPPSAAQDRAAAARLVTLTGAGGSGKTRLALRVAEALLPAFPDGVWLVELAPLAEAEMVPRIILTTLGLLEDPGQPAQVTLTSFLKTRQALLILDNCEHLIKACAKAAEALLQGCPDLRILATSREPMGIAGEVSFLVPMLATPDARQALPLEALSQIEAVRLFIDRARAAFSGFALTAGNGPAVAQVCRQLDGMPLAIELASARVKALSVEQIAARLDDRFRLLTSGSRTALPRQQTLRATMDWSYDLLPEAERIVLWRLAVFAGGCALEAAEAVCAGGAVENYEVLDLLAQLASKSLVDVQESDGAARYIMLETVRQYAYEKLEEAGGVGAARDQHAVFYLALAERSEAALMGRQQQACLEQLDLEHDNFRSALEWARASDQADLELRLAGALWRFWFLRGYLGEGQQCLERAQRQTRATPAARAKALAGAGFIANFRGDTATALRLCTQSLSLARETGNERLAALSLSLLGQSYGENGDSVAAMAALDESLIHARGSGDRWIIAFALTELVEAATVYKDHARAEAYAQESLALAREAGDTWLIAFSLFRAGEAATARGDYALARARHEESLALRRAIGDRLGTAYVLLGLANAAWAEGDLAMAWARTEERLEIERELNNQLGVAHVLGDMGWMASEQGDFATARSYFDRSVALCRQLGNFWCIAAQLHNLALAGLESEDYNQARDCLAESLAICREQQLKGYIEPMVIRALGQLAHFQGDYATARPRYLESLAGYQTIANYKGVAVNLTSLGGLMAMTGQPGRAAQIWGAAAMLWDIKWASSIQRWRREHNHAVATARDQLGEAVFAAAWAEGQALTLEQAIELALAG